MLPVLIVGVDFAGWVLEAVDAIATLLADRGGDASDVAVEQRGHRRVIEFPVSSVAPA